MAGKKSAPKLAGQYHGNFSWLVQGKIAGSDMPGRFNPVEKDLEWFAKQGVRAIVTLTEKPLPAKSVRGFEYLHIPVKEMGTPSFEEIMKFVEFAGKMELEGKPLLVHCNAGIGRTGTMLACYLVGNGLKAEKALDILESRRGYGLFTQGQYSAVYQFESILRMHEGEKQD
jgi:atypical dual specificity phosphatase